METFSLFLINNIIENWIVCFTEEEKERLIDIFFSINNYKIIILLSNSLKISKNSVYITNFLIFSLKKKIFNLKEIFFSLVETHQNLSEKNFLLDEFINSLCSISDRVSNIKKEKTEKFFINNFFFSNLIKIFFQFLHEKLNEKKEKNNNNDFENENTISLFVSLTTKLFRLGQNSLYSQHFVDCFVGNSLSLFQNFFCSCSPKLSSLVSNAVITSILKHLNNNKSSKNLYLFLYFFFYIFFLYFYFYFYFFIFFFNYFIYFLIISIFIFIYLFFFFFFL